MGKKGSWFSAIKRVFVPNSSSKDKQISGTEKKTSQEKKQGRRILKHGRSFIPLFREPSSIEKILEEADEQHLLVPLYYEQQKIASARPTSPRISSPRASSGRAASPRYSPPRASSPSAGSPRTRPLKVSSPRAASPREISLRAVSPRAASPRETSPRDGSPRVTSPRVASSKVNQNREETTHTRRPEPTLQVLHFSAIRIQAIFRGYMARKSFRAPRGLLRLQAMVKSNSVKRQTVNAMKQMQLLVRVQTQVRSRRIQMLENQWQAYKNNKDKESTLSKWLQMSEAGNENWDDSMLTKDETDQRWRRKVEALMKRERAMAYAHSHKLGKANPKSTMSFQSNGFPWWWKWLEPQPPSASYSESQSAIKDVHRTPSRAMPERKSSPLLQTTKYRYPASEYDNLESETPTSIKSAIPMRAKPFHTPGRTPPNSILRKYSRAKSGTGSPFPVKDDDSLTSCPPFSVPNYMTPTISAKAKARPNSSPRKGKFGTPSSDTMRRLTFPFTPNIGAFKWNRGSNKDAASLREFDRSTDRLSVDSTVSMPAIVGRKPFNRFV